MNLLILYPQFTWVSPYSLYLFTTLPSLKYSLVKHIDDCVITDPNDNIGLVDIENNRLDERVNEFHRSLGNYKQFNSLTNSYWLCLEDMPKKVIWTPLSHCLFDFSKAFDKLKSAIIIAFFIVFFLLVLIWDACLGVWQPSLSSDCIWMRRWHLEK